jgi:glyoxylase-like metal-dependent hydrolase (beta-lactamase superfamily II)
MATPYSDINAAAEKNPIVIHKLRDGVSMLEGSGGNIGVLSGRDGKFMVDAGIAVSKRKIELALSSLGGGRIRYLVNTHWHWDHTDGNEWVRRTGATVLADPNVIRRLGETILIPEWQHTFPPVSRLARPNQAVREERIIRFDGDRIILRHYAHGHTDGDMSVYFERADILATGDTFWNGVYPFIDTPTGGGIDGAIRAAEQNLRLAGPKTIVIPGHGPVGSRDDLQAFRDMLVDVRGRIAELKSRAYSLEQTIAAHPTEKYDTKWGQSVISGPLFISLVYRGV